MKRVFRLFAVLLIVAIGARAQQIQSLDSTDSERQRREKANANFTLLKNQFNNSTAALNTQLADALAGMATLTSTQTLENKTLKAPRIFSYTKAGLPGDAPVGTIAIVTDDQRGLWVMAASAVWQPFDDGQISGGLFGLDGGGSFDNSANLSYAIAAAASSGLPIVLKAGVYAIKDAVPGTLKGVTVIGNGATIKKISGGTDQGVLYVDYGTYEGWKFSGVNFDGGGLGPVSFNLSNASNLTFEDCSFRNYLYHVVGAGARNIAFRRCKFYGTKPGVMAAGSQDPAAVTGAGYGSGTQWQDGCENISFDDCDFHFCWQGIVTVGANANVAVADSVLGVKVTNCRFRGDWWNNPYKTGEWVVSAVSPSPTTFGPQIDISTGSFAGFFTNFDTICFPVQLRTGSAFTQTFANYIVATDIGLSASIGDVIETADGRRAEMVHITNANAVEILGWEAIDTFEPTAAPALNTAWRVRRYYSSTVQFHVSNTRVQLYQVPVNVFTAHTIADDGVSLDGRSFRTFAKMVYSGTHINNSSDVLIDGCRFRGSWADQISNFYSRQVRIRNNHIEYGQDEAITVTTCPSAVIEGNTVRNEGVGVYVGSDFASVQNNTFYNWALHYGYELKGAIELEGRSISASGNTFDFDHALSHGGFSPWCFAVYGVEMSGSVLSHNTGTGRLGQVYVYGSIVSTTVRDMVWAGPGSALVKGVLTASAILDFGGTAAQSSADLTITLTGAALGDPVYLGVPDGSVLGGSSFSAWVSAADTVTVRFSNYSSGALDPASGTFKVTLTRL